MSAVAPGNIGRHFLHPCTVFAHREEFLVTTLLGSCVAVSLWDPQLKVGGMNHFMLPLWNGDGLPTPKYGNIALEKLMERMLALGSRKEHWVAGIYGGAKVINAPAFSVGDRNIQVAQELLAQKGIPFPRREVSGNRAYRVLFNTRTGIAQVMHLPLPTQDGPTEGRR